MMQINPQISLVSQYEYFLFCLLYSVLKVLEKVLEIRVRQTTEGDVSFPNVCEGARAKRNRKMIISVGTSNVSVNRNLSARTKKCTISSVGRAPDS